MMSKKVAEQGEGDKQIGEKAWEKICRVCVGFMDLEKAYDRVNREALWQVLRMYGVGGKFFNGINNIYVNSLACVRVTGGESQCFRIDSGVRQVRIVSPSLFNVYMNAVKKVKMGMGWKEVRFQEERREWRLPGLLYAGKLVFCGKGNGGTFCLGV